MGTTFVANTQLITIDCKCGGVYAIQDRHYENCRQNGLSWSCPYCKTGWGFFGNSENSRLKRELEQARSSIAFARAAHDQTRAALRDTEHSLRAQKAAKTRIKNRIAHGVCPCCNRTFKDLAAHMNTKHPNYATAE